MICQDTASLANFPLQHHTLTKRLQIVSLPDPQRGCKWQQPPLLSTRSRNVPSATPVEPQLVVPICGYIPCRCCLLCRLHRGYSDLFNDRDYVFCGSEYKARIRGHRLYTTLDVDFSDLPGDSLPYEIRLAQIDELREVTRQIILWD